MSESGHQVLREQVNVRGGTMGRGHRSLIQWSNVRPNRINSDFYLNKDDVDSPDNANQVSAEAASHFAVAECGRFARLTLSGDDLVFWVLRSYPGDSAERHLIQEVSQYTTTIYHKLWRAEFVFLDLLSATQVSTTFGRPRLRCSTDHGGRLSPPA